MTLELSHLTRAQSSNSKNISYSDPVVFINLKAGSTKDISEQLPDLFTRHGHSVPRIHVVGAGELVKDMRAWMTAETDLVVMYGGDGSCKAAAELASEKDIPFIPLPGGTMNILPKALYNSDDWETALACALSTPKPRWLAAGIIHSQGIHSVSFYVATIIGEPSQMAQIREDARDGEMGDVIKAIPAAVKSISSGDVFDCECADGEVFKALNSLMLTCPNMSSGALDLDNFELAGAHRLGLDQLFRIGAHAIIDDWREAEDVELALTKGVKIMGTSSLSLLLDGEPLEVSLPMTVRLKHKGVKVLAPETAST